MAQRPARGLFPFVPLFGTLFLVATATAQAPREMLPAAPIVHKITSINERESLTINSGRILTLDKKIPQAQVNNPEILDLTPLSPNQIQIFAKKTGVTQVNLWDEAGQIYTVDVIVYGDARELEMILRDEFPNAALTLRPVANGVLVSGYVDQPDHVVSIRQIAEEFYPKVLTNIQVGGVHQVLLHVKAMEVSRTKLRNQGMDWAQISDGSVVMSTVSGLINSVTPGSVSVSGGLTTITSPTMATAGSPTFMFSVVDGTNAFFGVLDALEQNQLAKTLSEPTLVTVSGRPAYFRVGGEIPLIQPGTAEQPPTFQFVEYGTRVDFVPIVLGNGRIRLEVRPSVKDIDPARGAVAEGFSMPGFLVRETDTGVEMMAGQTLAIAGLVQERVEAERRGLPWVSEVPYLGVMFRRVKHVKNEVELLILVTPELVEAIDRDQMSPCGPGSESGDPGDWDLFMRGYLEVPKCAPDACSATSCNMPTMPGSGQAVVPSHAEGPAVMNAPSPAPEVIPPPAAGEEPGTAEIQGDAPAGPQPSAQPSPTDSSARPAPLPSRTAGVPARLAPSRPQNRQGQPAGSQSMPGFIGPVGYDSLK
ncbi:MAG: pilus assembly protein N-terminal domain-containing protein [Thermoguttaceae bacterium]|nr:pilus assembly protein N-terminal domain-containing protein [Thermoguttaceae bacterium]